MIVSVRVGGAERRATVAFTAGTSIPVQATGPEVGGRNGRKPTLEAYLGTPGPGVLSVRTLVVQKVSCEYSAWCVCECNSVNGHLNGNNNT